MNGSFERNKIINKVVVNSESGSRKVGLLANETTKELSSSKAINSTCKKRLIKGDNYLEERVSGNILINTEERSIRCDAALDGGIDWGADYRKNGMDVVSFTFTSPIKRSIPGSQSSGQAAENIESFGVDSHRQNDQSDSEISKISSLGLNVIGGDALSILLEQKLKELKYRIESSQCNLVETGPVASSCIHFARFSVQFRCVKHHTNGKWHRGSNWYA
ncbi:hypothetical protein L1049_019507 [Liquidambar formosana]|uniref:Uncharacterized protein n=1 Tax=Liquidambar formosana TaxID=63359 RepID=A0AAP0SCP7_LIQFO